jgi:hypothetical protein
VFSSKPSRRPGPAAKPGAWVVSAGGPLQRSLWLVPGGGCHGAPNAARIDTGGGCSALPRLVGSGCRRAPVLVRAAPGRARRENRPEVRMGVAMLLAGARARVTKTAREWPRRRGPPWPSRAEAYPARREIRYWRAAPRPSSASGPVLASPAAVGAVGGAGLGRPRSCGRALEPLPARFGSVPVLYWLSVPVLGPGGGGVGLVVDCARATPPTRVATRASFRIKPFIRVS